MLCFGFKKVGAMAHSRAAMRLAACEPLQVLKIRSNASNLISHGGNGGFDPIKFISSITVRRTGNISSSKQTIGVSQLSGVRRLGEGGLRAPQLPKAETVPRPILREKHSNLLTCSLSPSSTVQVATSMFTLGTAFVVPFYTAMVFAPKWKWTKKLVENDIPFIVLGAMYVYLLFLSWTPETLGLMFASKYWLPELPGITRMFSSTITVASAWIHLLVADLFCGRYVYLDGLQHKVETRHSLVFCLMMCPIGIISHLVTKVLTSFARRIDGESTTDIGKVLA
ncbi:protein MAO HUZI 4, chloroplastic isoform X4 [Physcomitrium patens]|uniref:Neoxanthin synthase n=2 Tax=Physcomitrium patens TaxID=3218 RepID=A0A7I4ACV5_PHYPA|nr:protein ABA DEFICIENT 4, chloroplastic-like isoform X4 [Physcomitrium patens]|eukprot:XP_024391769.1 protein ABA DEFICIENT 4, chloroplastic-like isoform X4 [Physcomitrella patens]